MPSHHEMRTMLADAGRGLTLPGRLLDLVYDQLRALAHHQMALEPAGVTIQPTALVHEAYIKLLGDTDLAWASKTHYFAAAAQAMRRILVDHARKRKAIKRGGDRTRLSLDEVDIPLKETEDDLIALDAALHKLAERDARKSRIVMLRFFAGLTIEETAQAMDLSLTTVKDEWRFARAWLYSEVAAHGQD